MFDGGDSVSAKVKEVGDLVMSGEEALGLPGVSDLLCKRLRDHGSYHSVS